MLAQESTLGLAAIDITVLVAYFVGITAFGAMFGRFTKSTRDFFVAGQRFPAWLIAASCVATLVGSYSFVKYSAAGYRYGLASAQTYLNDWFWMPLWMFGWLPILYFGGILTVPEYFMKRFDKRVRLAATITLLFYLVGYIGINLFTLGTALAGVFGLPITSIWVFWIALIMAGMCMAYEFTGGQTSVIFTDLLQSVLLLVAGLGVFLLGIFALGGFDDFWAALPPGHGRGLANFNDSPSFNFVGVFWQDGMAGGLAFYFMNQGMLLRFLTARSITTARRAASWVILLLMPLTAIAVSGAGWVGRAMAERGDLEVGDASHAFLVVSKALCSPGLLGLVIAALLAALMSTADTLINASSSVVVNDIYKPARPGRSERHYLKVARWTSLGAAVAGALLVPLYMQHKSIYQAHAFFMALITPPMATALLMAFVWPRYNAAGALWTLIGGIVLMFVSWPISELVWPFSHGIPEQAEGSTKPDYTYIRACYGMAVSALLGTVATLLTRRPEPESVKGLTIWTCRQTRSSAPKRKPRKIRTKVIGTDEEVPTEDDLPCLPLSAEDRRDLAVEDGDRIFVDDARVWLAGLRSTRFVVAGQAETDAELTLPRALLEANKWRDGHAVVLQRID